MEPDIAAAHERGVRVTLAGSEQRFEQFAATAPNADGRIIMVGESFDQVLSLADRVEQTIRVEVRRK